ncbi:MAG: lysophospholipid acyltransferase family protein [Bacteriovoracia bacterium]
MRILIQIKAVFVTLFLLVFLLVPVCLVALPFRLERRLKIVCPVWAIFGRLLIRYACQAHIRISEDHRSAQYKGVPCFGLYIANHQSYMDIPLLVTLYQAPPIMKKEVLYIPFFGWMAWISGAMPVSRSSISSRRKVFEKAKKRILKDRIGLGVYPEGTRSKDALPKAFKDIKRTLLVFAYNEKIPVVPSSIYGTRGVINSKGMIVPGRSLGVIVHKEINPAEFTSSEEFAEACWTKVIQGHDEMKEKLGPLNENLS